MRLELLRNTENGFRIFVRGIEKASFDILLPGCGG